MTTDSSITALLAVPVAGITLAVEGDPAAVAGLRRIAEQFYPPVASAHGAVWTLVLEHRPVRDGPPPPDEPAHRAEFDVAARRVTVRCGAANWLPLLGTRYARTLARAMAIERGAIPLHGAAVDIDGTGVILVGDKMAGKTTSALSLVRCGAALVSNDDVLLAPRGDCAEGAGEWSLTGGPRSIGIRVGSLAEHRPMLTAAQLSAATAAHPANRESKRFLHPGDIGRIGGSTRRAAPARLLIELCCEPRATRSHELDDDQAATVLRNYLEPTADRHRFEFLEALGAPRPALPSDTVASLVRTLDFHRFTHPVSGWIDELLSFVKDIAAARGDGAGEVAA